FNGPSISTTIVEVEQPPLEQNDSSLELRRSSISEGNLPNPELICSTSEMNGSTPELNGSTSEPNVRPSTRTNGGSVPTPNESPTIMTPRQSRTSVASLQEIPDSAPETEPSEVSKFYRIINLACLSE